MGFRFIHAADLHVDSPFRGMSALPTSIRERVRESTFRALDELVALALRERVDFIVISGDVYDAADRSLRAQLRLQAAMRRLASGGVAVFIVHGNHDPADGRTAHLDWPESVHVFAADRMETVPVIATGRGLVAEVHGRSFGTAAVRDNLALGFRDLARKAGVYQIAVLHANVDGDEGHDNYAPCSMRDLTESGIDYWALGHIHTRRVLHERPWVVYPGNPQGRSVRETDARGCYIADVDDAGDTKLTFHPLDDVRWMIERIDIAPYATEQELLSQLAATAHRVRDEAGGRAAVVRFVLEGRGQLHEALRSGSGAEEWASLLREEAREQAEDGTDDWVWVESIVDETVPAMQLDELMAEPNFLGEMLRQGRELLSDEAALTEFAAAAALPLLQDGPAGRKLGEDWLRQRQTELLRLAEIRILDALAQEGGGSA